MKRGNSERGNINENKKVSSTVLVIALTETCLVGTYFVWLLPDDLN